MAIRASAPEASAQWYEKVLGLSRVQPEEWSPFPIMMLAGNSGIAIFSDNGDPVSQATKKSFHIAFRIESEGLQDFNERLKRFGVSYTEEDHKYFRSIYFEDPDGYRLEVTMKVLDF